MNKKLKYHLFSIALGTIFIYSLALIFSLGVLFEQDLVGDYIKKEIDKELGALEHEFDTLYGEGHGTLLVNEHLDLSTHKDCAHSTILYIFENKITLDINTAMQYDRTLSRCRNIISNLDKLRNSRKTRESTLSIIGYLTFMPKE